MSSDEDTVHSFHEQPEEQEPHSPQQLRKYSKKEIIEVLTAMVNNQLPIDTDSTPFDEDQTDPSNELPQKTPETPPATSTTPPAGTTPILRQDTPDALNAPTLDGENDKQTLPPCCTSIENVTKLKKQNAQLLRKMKRLEKTITNTKKDLSCRHKRTLEAVQTIRKIYYSNKAELNQAQQHMQYMHSIITTNQTGTPDEIIDLYNPFGDTNQ